MTTISSFGTPNFAALEIPNASKTDTQADRLSELDNRPATLKGETEETKAAFQKFIAGNFYRQMMKTLRKLTDKPAYIHGGQAEQIFQQEMDEHVIEQLSEDHGSVFAEPLFQVWTQHRRAELLAKNQSPTKPVDEQPSVPKNATVVEHTQSGETE